MAKQKSLPKWGGKIPPNLKLPLRDGDIDRPEDEAYAGCYFLNANSREKPQVVDKQVQPILDQTEVYGAYVEVISYDKLLKDAKQRNKALFDKLFEPKAKDLVHPELLGRENKN